MVGFYLSLLKFWGKSAQAFSRNLEFCEESRFFPIPMGFTTVTHMCINGPMSWILLGPNIIILLNKGKNKFYPWIKNLLRKSTTKQQQQRKHLGFD